MSESETKRRWYRPTPGRLIAALLAWEVVLLAVEPAGWIPKGYTVLLALASVVLTIAFLFAWFLFALVFRRRFQYSIRSLLLLTVAVAVPMSWLTVEMKRTREQLVILRELKKWDGIWSISHSGNLTPEKWSNFETQFGLLIYGDRLCVALGHSKNTDAALELLKGLPELRELHLFGSEVTDEGLKNISLMENLSKIDLDATAITDVGLENIKNLINLEELDLSNTKITDSGMQYLQNLKKLRKLDINNIDISDRGIECLKNIRSLEILHLDNDKNFNPRITDEGLEHINALSNLEILWVQNTEITDAGLMKLKGLRKMKQLYIENPGVTVEGERRLWRELPNLRPYADSYKDYLRKK
jgi:hypothetical protein